MPFFHKYLIPYYIVFGLLCLLCSSHILFWDTYQLCGKQAWALYDTSLFNWILPAEIDSGHPPLFGFYHAVLWRIFSPSLAVSHLAMLPFLCSIVYFYFRLGVHYLDAKRAIFLLPLLLVDSVFMGQSTLVSPDLILLCCMLMCWLGIVQKSNHFVWIASVGLGLISMRGMMVLAALVMFEFFILLSSQSYKARIVHMPKYAPAILLVITFLSFHYIKTGWLGHHEDSSWSESFDYVNTVGVLKNIAVYIWRLFDFGRVFLIASLTYLGYRYYSSIRKSEAKELVGILSFFILVISPILLAHKGLVLHRYLLPIFLTLSILFWYLLFSLTIHNKIRNGIWFFVVFSMLAGNLWVYPRQISQGWDSTLGHLPYYHLREKMMAYLDQENIHLHEVGTAFPNIGPLKYYDPSKNKPGFSEYDLDRDDYIFYSNIYNDFTDEELDRLVSEEWIPQKSLYFYPVEIVLYKKNR